MAAADRLVGSNRADSSSFPYAFKGVTCRQNQHALRTSIELGSSVVATEACRSQHGLTVSFIDPPSQPRRGKSSRSNTSSKRVRNLLHRGQKCLRPALGNVSRSTSTSYRCQSVVDLYHTNAVACRQAARHGGNRFCWSADFWCTTSSASGSGSGSSSMAVSPCQRSRLTNDAEHDREKLCLQMLYKVLPRYGSRQFMHRPVLFTLTTR
jgi:hypothetical protein